MRIQLKEGALELEGWENAGSTQMAIAAHVSSAISLKRQADALEKIVEFICDPEDKTKVSGLYSTLYYALVNSHGDTRAR